MTVHPGHSALPAKVQQEALAMGRNITGEGRGESRLFNIQHTTSSGAMAHGEPAQVGALKGLSHHPEQPLRPLAPK